MPTTVEANIMRLYAVDLQFNPFSTIFQAIAVMVWWREMIGDPPFAYNPHSVCHKM